MSFIDVLRRAKALLREERRLSLRALKRELGIDDDEIEEVASELVDAQRVAILEGGVLVWVGEGEEPEARSEPAAPPPERDLRAYTPKHLAEKILQSKSAIEGERKQVTVLFADVKGSTELAEELDAEQWHAISDEFLRILADGVHRFEGRVNQFTGDGIMALFGAPIAHEDHAQRACYASLHLRDELKRYGEQVKRDHGVGLAFRIGLNSGEVVVGKIGDDLRMDYTAKGLTTNLADRMQKLADPGAAYLSENTARLVEGFFELRDLGEFELKGVRNAIHVYELEGLGALRTRLDVSRARGYSKFVGRTDEMATLQAALERAIQGNAQVIGVVGEAGVGKSRLCDEFAAQCRARGLALYQTHALAHTKNVPFLSTLELLRDYFRITGRDNDEASRDKIAGRSVRLDETLADALPLLFDFLGVPDPQKPPPQLDAEKRQQELFMIIRRLVHARSEREPAVLVMDDLHWMDGGSESFLEHMVESLPGTRTLLLVNFRPEYQGGWMGRSYYQQLPLVPLGPDALDELLRHLLGSDPSIGTLVERIRERTVGNPFFTEEVVQSLVESGALEGSPGAYQLLRPVEQLAVPETVQSVLAARIDRLPEREKQVLQSASVIGKKFPESVLSRAVELPDQDLADSLRVLTAGDFIYEEALYPEAEYAFKHPLTRDVAYESQLSDRRARVHARVASALEEVDTVRLNERAALLAHHWESAAEPLRAARWHRRAAEWVGASDPAEALRHWRRIPTLLDPLPETQETTELGVAARGQILTLSVRWGTAEDDVERLLAEGRELAARSQDPRARLHLLRSMGTYQVLMGEIEAGMASLEEAVRLADELGDGSQRIAAGYFLWAGRFLTGQLQRALENVDESLVLLEAEQTLGGELIGADPLVQALAIRGLALAYAGRIAEAEDAITRMIERAHEVDEVVTLAMAESFTSRLYELKGDAPRALAHVRRAVELAERRGGASLKGVVYGTLGKALFSVGQFDEAVETLEQTAELGNPFTRLFEDPRLALAQLERGEPDAARAAALHSIEKTAKGGARLFEAEARLTLATVLLRTGAESAREQVEAELARAEVLIDATGSAIQRPSVHEVRAEVAELEGDADARRHHLREAHHLFTEMGATGHAERVARELGL